MSDLAAIIKRQIEATGPMTLADYMTLCLAHPDHGYYATRDPFGVAGDFTTAPEISQMFGELLGLALAQSWLDQGAPSKIALAELGPGRGTLMADLLRASKAVPGFHEALSVHLVETSPVLRTKQTETIPVDVTHHAAVETLPEDQPCFLIANEFFDALPIRQFQRDAKGWRERCVGLTKDGTLGFGLSDLMHPEHLDTRLVDTKEGDIAEVSQTSAIIAAQIGRRVADSGGLALFVDYGDWRSQGDTFQALQNHNAASPFETPGEADLTAHVDFEALAKAAVPAAHTKLATQGVFLERLGITSRAQSLASNLNGEALESHIAAHRRLTHPSEMGTLFKVMALYPEDAPLPPGFAE